MRFTKSLVTVLCVLLTIAAVGCSRHSGGLAALEPRRGDITDPVVLEKLWQDYVYDMLDVSGYNIGFASAAELNPATVARYCWSRYTLEHGTEGLRTEDGALRRRLFPLSTALEYTKRYFNLTSLDVSGLSPDTYDPQRQAFLLGTHNLPRPAYNARTSWGDRLARAARSSDGTVTAVVASMNQGRAERVTTYVLKSHPDGGLYFVAGKSEYINNHLVSLTGHYRRYDPISVLGEDPDQLVMLGEADEHVILARTSGTEGKNSALLLLEPRRMRVSKKLELGYQLDPGDASLTNAGVVIRLTDRVVTVDASLMQASDAALPAVLAAAACRDYFAGYDVSPDQQSYVYADADGVKSVDAAGNVMVLLPESVRGSLYGTPRFVAGGRKLAITIRGYDGPVGYALYDLNSGSTGTYRIASGSSSTREIRHDTGLLEVNSPLPNDAQPEPDYRTVYLDFASGELREVSLSDRGDTDFLRPADYTYVGLNYAALVTGRIDPNDSAKSVYTISRLDLKTFKLEPAVVTIRAAAPWIIGVLADGRIIFRYELNPSERGICITE